MDNVFIDFLKTGGPLGTLCWVVWVFLESNRKEREAARAERADDRAQLARERDAALQVIKSNTEINTQVYGLMVYLGHILGRSDAEAAKAFTQSGLFGPNPIHAHSSPGDPAKG